MNSKISLAFMICAVVCIFKVQDVFGGATEEQMWAAGGLMRDVCLPKFPKITKEIADGIRAGTLPNDKDAKCYVNCILEMMQTMKKGKFLYEASLKQVDILMPDDYKDEYKAGLAACKDAAVGVKNNCEAAGTIFTCLRGQITRFVFP
ncbi:general odorant-binding protein 19a isoform X4 [Stomoxys calcitrans]|uniref:general odorant-binding protein 19a isoform X4 n=1 Tax=Stomoxys calcitrans TaxID=35570 RepID=UPI0027E2BA45|nr:general odorant-binding protein 19a isoform X4 [Stomoxys calcitrans]